MVVEEVTPPTLGSDLCVTIGLRINGTTIWYTGGIHWESTRKTVWNRNGATQSNVTNTNIRKMVVEVKNRKGQMNRGGAAYDGSNGYLFDYDGSFDNQTDLTTKAELIVVVGYQAAQVAAQTCEVRLRWRRPWKWATISGLLS
jgi:hypothetical protein